MTLFEILTHSARKRAEYRRTVAEIEALSPATAADLGIDRQDARRIARQAVFGR